MRHEAQFEAGFPVPGWSSPSDARERLEREIDMFVSGAAAATAELGAALALKVTAGLGKTATALRVIAHHGEALLARGHVLVYVPTLDLAERACADFRKLAPGLPSRVVRGRDAARPGDPARKMCVKADLAKAISGFVPSVTQALCRRFDPGGGVVQSSCAQGCPYLGQKDVQGPHVVFLSHAYLGIDPPVDRECDIALRVIDEKVWPTLKRTTHLTLDDFMRPPSDGFPDDIRGLLSAARSAVVDGLQRGLPLHDHLEASKLTSEQLQALADAEEASRTDLEIGPRHSASTVAFRLDTFDRKSFLASRRRERIFERLAGGEAGHGLRLFEKASETGSHQVIEVSAITQVPRDAPVLLLDADADPEITERVAPGARFVSIQSPPVADIVQISDRTLSNSWLLHPERGKHRRAAVLKILAREVERAAGGGVLVVATKSVLGALHADLGNSAADDDALRQLLLGADPRWFGPRTQGVNDYENYASIVVIGRLQPGVSAIEASARAVFSLDALPVAAHDSGPLPPIKARWIMADGTEQEAETHAHPDPRVQAILAQTRECGSLQAIARLRLVSPNRAKRVVILSSLPLPDFPVSRLTPFAALERGLEHEPDWRGFERMETALHADMGRPVVGTRLSAAGLAADLPRDFQTKAGAERFRRGRPTPDMLSLCHRVAEANAWPITPLLLRRPGGGKPVPAIVLDDRGSALAMARTLWPEFTPEFS